MVTKIITAAIVLASIGLYQWWFGVVDLFLRAPRIRQAYGVALIVALIVIVHLGVRTVEHGLRLMRKGLERE